MQSIVDWFRNLEPLTLGIIMSVIVSVARMMYDNETSFKRGVSEVILCTSFTFIGGKTLLIFGIDPTWSLLIGGAIGALGNLVIRKYVSKFIDKKISKQ